MSKITEIFNSCMRRWQEMYMLGIRLSEPEPDPIAYRRVGETACLVCGVSYRLHVRVEDGDSEETVAKAQLKFGEFLSHSPLHQGGHLSTIPLVMGLGDL